MWTVVCSARLLLLATLVALGLGLAACDNDDGQAETQTLAFEEVEEPAADDPGETEEPTVDPEPTPGAHEEPGFEREVELPDPVPLDLEVRHDSGSFVRLNGIAFTQSAVEVDATIVNGDDMSQLLADPLSGGVLLEDDLANRYAFRPPRGNQWLQLGPGEQLEGTLAFAGRFPPEATRLTLVFNPEREAPISPQFAFEDIPIRPDAQDVDGDAG